MIGHWPGAPEGGNPPRFSPARPRAHGPPPPQLWPQGSTPEAGPAGFGQLGTDGRGERREQAGRQDVRGGARRFPGDRGGQPLHPLPDRPGGSPARQGGDFYGAWWCSHCFHQKNLFGTEAARKLPYLECDKDDQGRQKCVAAKVKAFPTWVLGSERREGVQSLAELSAWSGFKGATK
ncbi:hypothetical protein [Cyanobium sp. ATX-6F1]|uniref:hypothetical protein n=1 Tax=Cyanobium sp. ATX-6F1 TaxID=3137388 RepID=UPI0039BE68D0